MRIPNWDPCEHPPRRDISSRVTVTADWQTKCQSHRQMQVFDRIDRIDSKAAENHVPPAGQVGAMRWVALLPAAGRMRQDVISRQTKEPPQLLLLVCDGSWELGQPVLQVKSHQASFFSLESGQTSSIEDGCCRSQVNGSQ